MYRRKFFGGVFRMLVNWQFTDVDERISDKLQGFIPEKVYDSHAHLYRLQDNNTDGRTFIDEGPDEAGFDVWREHTGRYLKGSQPSGGLFFPHPSYNCNVDASNDYLSKQLGLSPESRGLILISPDYPASKIERYLMNDQIIGFKPFFYYSKEKPEAEASILSFFPEWAWEMAHARKLTATLHIVKNKALADPGNQDVICRMCRKYPGVRLILAHAARGFHPQNTIDGLEILGEFDNIWFDSSAICEAKSLKAILKHFGHRRLLWGTDFPYSEIRGKVVSVGDSFVWMDNTCVSWDKLFPVCNPVLIGIESLLALKEASEEFGLNQKEIQDIFINNILNLINQPC
jgi:glutamate-1-semialdehyde 2,1-aminomutase